MMLSSILLAAAVAADSFSFFNIVAPWPDHEQEIAADMVEYVEKTGNEYVLYSLTLHPEGYPAWEKVERMVASYRRFAKALEGTKAKPAILLQAIVGHWPRVDDRIEPWQRTIDVNGKVFRFCALDERFRDYIRKVGAALAKEKPAFILGDDDIRAFSPEAECFCPLHVAEFNRRTGGNLTAEELMEHIKKAGCDDELHRAFVRLQADTVNLVCRSLREGIDSVDPSIPGGVSIPGWVWSTAFAPETAAIMAGKGNPTVGRLPNGLYNEGTLDHDLAYGVYNTQSLVEWYRGGIDILLDESDTFPHNLWSKSAAAMHAKLAASVFVGTKGAKAWYVNARKREYPVSRNYTRVLAEHRGYYRALSGLESASKPTGVLIPLHAKFPDQGVHPTRWGAARHRPHDENSWPDRVFAFFGVPFACTLDYGLGGIYAIAGREAVGRYTDEELRKLLSRKLLLDGEASQALFARGFGEYLGAAVADGGELKFTAERDEKTGARPVFPKSSKAPLFTMKEGAEALAWLIRTPYSGANEFTRVAPSAVRFRNSLGGTVVMAAYNMRMGVSYQYSEARQAWLASVLDAFGTPVEYVSADAQTELVLTRRQDDGRDLVYAVNLCHDPLTGFRFHVSAAPKAVELLGKNGVWQPVDFSWKDGIVEIPGEVPCYQERVFRFAVTSSGPHR